MEAGVTLLWTELEGKGWKRRGADLEFAGFKLKADPPYRVKLTSPHGLLVLSAAIPRAETLKKTMKLIESQTKGASGRSR
jgi:hypothetical protein